MTLSLFINTLPQAAQVIGNSRLSKSFNIFMRNVFIYISGKRGNIGSYTLNSFISVIFQWKVIITFEL